MSKNNPKFKVSVLGKPKTNFIDARSAPRLILNKDRNYLDAKNASAKVFFCLIVVILLI